MKYLVKPINIGFIALSIVLAMTTFGFAQTASIDEDGMITISGQITSVNRDQFTMTYNDSTIDVMMDGINEQTVEQLIDSGIVSNDAFVSVTGTLEEEMSQTVIDASNVTVYNN